MRAKYATKGNNHVDDNADYYFDVAGTSHRFHIKSTQNADQHYYYRTIWDMKDWGNGYKEFKHPASQVAVNFIITGSEEYGYYTSMDMDSTPTAWMKELYPVIKDRELRHVIMPGSHDAGMGVWQHTWEGVPDNTQTQGLSIYDQLVAGSRYFDLRVIEYEPLNGDWEYISAHLGNEKDSYGRGGGGESVQSIIDGINKFYRESPGEVVILWLRYLNHIKKRPAGSAVEGGYKADKTLMEKWFKFFTGIDNRCLGKSGDADGLGFGLDTRNMSTFMDQNDKKGCVLIAFRDDGNINQDAPKSRPAEGIYELKYFDGWDGESSWVSLLFLFRYSYVVLLEVWGMI